MSDTDEIKNVRTIRERVHEIIFGADTFYGAVFDVLLLFAIICSITVLCFETVPGIGRPVVEDGVEIAGKYQTELTRLSWFFTFLFTFEYVVRLYCVKRPWKFIWSFWGIVDLLAFLPDYFMLLPGITSDFHSRSFSVIRSLRLLRVFRIFQLGWFQFEADDLSNAIFKARAKIVVFLAVVMIIVTVVGTLMYEIENMIIGDKSKFESIPDGIYWAIVTMTTVGFGDIVPITIPGKFLSAILILIGYSLIIVPTGFVSAEIIEAKKKANISTRSCSSCVTEGHDKDAQFCKYCGERL